MQRIFSRLKEPSTIRALLLIVGVLGYRISPEQSEMIITASGLAIGLVGVGTGDSK